MSGFENYDRDAAEIAREIGAKLVILGLDFRDEAAMRSLAREALDHSGEVGQSQTERHSHDVAKFTLFGLIGLMLRTMEESAEFAGAEVHGNDAWKAIARALWAERAARGNDDAVR